MAEFRAGTAEARFADLIWENEPVASGQLAKFGEAQFQWKKTTSFTVLGRLCDKGIFQNIKGTVTSLISKQEFYSLQSEKFVEEAFHGSLPAFLTAFTARKSLTSEEVDHLRSIIAEYDKQ